MEIRFLTAHDASEYWSLRLEALEGDPEAFGASAQEHRSLSLEEVVRRLGSDGAEMFVVGALYDGRLSGTAGFYRENWIEDSSQGTHEAQGSARRCCREFWSAQLKWRALSRYYFRLQQGRQRRFACTDRWELRCSAANREP